jgi:autoinducer 2-degrading protein
MHTVIVDLQVKPDLVEAFLEATGESSRASRRDGPGCLRFDVHRANDDLPEAGR